MHCSSSIKLELAARNIDPLFYLMRHFHADWGDVTAEEWQENDANLARSGRLFSRYNAPFGEIWVITTDDRSETFMCFPGQYIPWATGMTENSENTASTTFRKPPFDEPSNN
ncbi:MAG: hypothetical protein LBC99_09055 [Spirochaetota bacterium]|nr:hypothetical protein [Spirochaetota bacterium]